jgi:hypothetical protein
MSKNLHRDVPPERWIGYPENARREGNKIVYEKNDIKYCIEPYRKFLVNVKLSNGDVIDFGIYLNGMIGLERGYDGFTSLLKSDSPRLENVLTAWQTPPEWTRAEAKYYIQSIFENDFNYMDSTGAETRVLKNAIVSISVLELINNKYSPCNNYKSILTT